MKTLKLTVIFLLTFLVGQTQTKNFIDQPYIEVNGNADTLIIPNEIFIKIIISEKDSRDKISIEELEIKMVNALKTLGFNTERDLTTIDISSNFKFYLLKSKDILKTKQYILKVSDGMTATKVFMQLEELGISNTSIERVDHSNLENIKNYMRTKAVENAKVRAMALTKSLNQVVGTAINIIDNENYNTGNMLEGRAAGVVIRGYGTYKTGDLPKIDFEKIKVTASINIKFMPK